MIFGQYKHAITFAVIILAVTVLVVDPGSDEPDATAAPAVQPSPAPLAASNAAQPAAAPAVDDPAWYDETTSAPANPAEADDGGYDTTPAPSPAPPAPGSHAAPAAPPAAQAATEVGPPPPPQVYRPG